MAISTTYASAFNNATISSTALTLEDVGFSAAEVSAANRMRLTVETAAIRYRYDGTSPTASVGHLLAVGAVLLLDGNQNIELLELIADASDGTVMVTLESH